ncbi:MAG: sugar ABC transporter permease [Ilumatobacteraceae bacterium]|jgi:arabinogalactan oligomer/maltooligosaccharide transport system permease protein|nr:sugar ABC transporter permease [Ilumatobacteraceae bacterium]
MTLIDEPRVGGPGTGTARRDVPDPGDHADGGGGGFQGPSGTHRGFGGWFADTGWRHLVALIALVFALFPVYWVVMGALDPSGSLATQELVPDELSLDNFRTLFEEQPFWTWFRNSMVVCFATSIGTVALCALSAYAFSRMRFRGRRVGLMSLLFIQMFPNTVAVVAIFLVLQRIGDVFPALGLGQLSSLTLVYLGGAIGIQTWLIKGFFDSIPKELDESAKMDGATHFQIFWKVILPLAVPILVVVFLLQFIVTINELILAEALLRGNEQNHTLAIGLSTYVQAGFDSRWGPFAAGSLIAAIPVLIMFYLAQRYIVAGLTAGAVKG